MRRSVQMKTAGVPVARKGAPRCKASRFPIKRFNRMVRWLVQVKNMPLLVADETARRWL